MTKKSKSAQNILMWALMALLVAGLGGFGIDGFLSQRVTAIGSVGDREISAQEYARALQAELAALQQQVGQSIDFQTARALGVDTRVRAQLVTQAAVENEAQRIGISVGDLNVQRTVMSVRAFQGPTGGFDRETYRFALENAGLTPAEFEESVRREAARGILQAATAAGIDTPENFRAPLVEFYATGHDFALFTLTEEALTTPVADPDEAAIQAYYDANIEAFTTPETRHITYAWITPQMILDSIEVEEDAIRALYEQRIEDYVQPERRLVERLVFGDEAQAQAAMARIEAGEASFDDLVAERDLTLDDVDLGDVSEAQLGAAGPAVFALEEPGAVVGPLASNLGPALFRMNAILNAQETPYEEARDALRAELARDRARRAIAEQQEHFDDLLAGGATIEDMANETPMELGTIDWTAQSEDGIAAYSEFATAAAAITTEDFPELMALADGGLFTIRLDSVTPPTPRPLDEVRAEAAAGARRLAVEAALLARGQELSAELARDGIEAFSEAHGLVPETFEGVTRLDRLPQVPAAMLDPLFEAEPGATVLGVADGSVLMALVTGLTPPDLEDQQTRRLLSAIDEQIGAALAQDVFTYFARALESEAGISFNQPAIDAVNNSFN
ncbi:MAG: peptidyl-prolyl cis-trans isomerase [Pararhodobacter sp.]